MEAELVFTIKYFDCPTTFTSEKHLKAFNVKRGFNLIVKAKSDIGVGVSGTTDCIDILYLSDDLGGIINAFFSNGFNVITNIEP